MDLHATEAGSKRTSCRACSPRAHARRRNALVSGLTILLALLLWPTTSRGEQIVVTHAQGETVLAATPKTVVTLDLAALETLDAIGVDVTGVPSSHMPEHLSKYRDSKYVKIGTLFEPDYEAINAASPDLIIVGARSAAKYKELSRLAATLDLSTDDSAFLASVFRNARSLGRIFGREDAIEARIEQIESDIRTLREKSRGGGRGLVLLTTGGRMSAYGPRSRFGALHNDFGIAPAVETLDTAVHGQSVTFEFILEANPDWLFIIDRDTAVGQAGRNAAQILDNPLVARTSAWQKGHVVYLDPVRWYLVGGGLVSLQANVDQIARVFAAQP